MLGESVLSRRAPSSPGHNLGARIFHRFWFRSVDEAHRRRTEFLRCQLVATCRSCADFGWVMSPPEITDLPPAMWLSVLGSRSDRWS
jgi:hypothetical protein